MFLSYRGKLGRPNGIGNFVLGHTRLGEENTYTGVYQRRFRESDPVHHIYNKNVSKICVKMRYYWPSNMFTRPQHSYCAKFKLAMIAWGNLTAEEKDPWNRKGRKLQTRGNGLFVKAYMLDRELKP